MKINDILSILRNPYGRSEKEKKEARLCAADKIEELQDAYLNMRKFAEDNGIDTCCKNKEVDEESKERETEEEYDCPIHGKLGGIKECPRC